MVITQNDLSMSKVHSKKAKDVKGGTTCVDIIQNVMEQ
jgi:hypothetical protein